MSEPFDIDTLAALNKAAADGLRLQVLQLLQQDSFGVLELADIFDISQSRLSHHLKILAQAGLLTTRREGNSIFYRRALVNGGPLDSIRRSVFQAVDALPDNQQAKASVARIYKERAEQSQMFFEKHAGKFTEVQDLIAGYEHYADSIQEVMSALNLPAKLPSTVLISLVLYLKFVKGSPFTPFSPCKISMVLVLGSQL